VTGASIDRARRGERLAALLRDAVDAVQEDTLGSVASKERITDRLGGPR
jgi:hypothetical protein